MKILLVIALIGLGLSSYAASTKRKPSSSNCFMQIENAEKSPLDDKFYDLADSAIEVCKKEMSNQNLARKMAASAILGICETGTYGQAGAGGDYNIKSCKLKAYSIALLISDK